MYLGECWELMGKLPKILKRPYCGALLRDRGSPRSPRCCNQSGCDLWGELPACILEHESRL